MYKPTNSPTPLRSRFRTTMLAAQALLLTVFSFGALPTHAAASNCNGATILNIVAHEDDDLLFLSPDLVRDVQAGRCVRTVFVTAGESGNDADYWLNREAGSRAAYAKMAGVANNWKLADAGIASHPISLYTLNRSTVSLEFMHLPDGAEDGAGFDTYGNQSLQKLWQDVIPAIQADDASSSYSRQDLITTLASLMSSYNPTQIRVQNFVSGFEDGDHSDHHASAYFAKAAHAQYATAHTFSGYKGYPVSADAANVSGADLASKKAAFYKYASFDGDICNTDATCKGSDYASWLKRQYIVGTDNTSSPTPTPAATPTPTPTATPTPTPTVPVPGSNIALQATATASSEDIATTQRAIKAIDGIIGGYPGDYTTEWSTVGGGAGSWLDLAWATPQAVTKIVLYDRPNLNDRINGGTITFSDGSTVKVPALNNDGTATTLTFGAKTITSLRLSITAIGKNTANVGLSEIQVY